MQHVVVRAGKPMPWAMRLLKLGFKFEFEFKFKFKFQGSTPPHQAKPCTPSPESQK
jgi:hypothetical protein